MKKLKEVGLAYNPEIVKSIGDIWLEERKDTDICYIKDGIKVMNEWDFFNKIGWIEKFKQDGLIFNPTHNFDKLKPFRIDLFNERKNNFIDERKTNNLNTTDYDLNAFYIVWLYNEIKVINQWLSGNDINGNKKRRRLSTSDQIETSKYKVFIENEIEKMNQILNPADKYYNEFFKIIDNSANMSIFDFKTTLNHTTQKFKTEIITNLENKDTERLALSYIERIKIKFLELVPNNNVIGHYLKYKKSCDYWCKKNNCTNSPQLFQTYSSKLSPLFETVPGDLDDLTDFPNAKNIYFDFFCFIRFDSIKNIYDFLLKQEGIVKPLPLQSTTKIVGPTYFTDKTLTFINEQFKSQINENSLTRYHIIHVNFPFLDFDIARNEIKSYLQSADNSTLSKISKLSKENSDMYFSTLQHFNGNEKGIKAFNIITQEDDYIKYENQIQRYKLRDISIKHVLDKNFDLYPLQPDEISHCIDNYKLAEYCLNVLNFIEENNYKLNSSIINHPPNNESVLNHNIKAFIMYDKDYLNLLIDGYKNNKDFFANHIYRESLIAKEKYIEPEEFFSRCSNMIDKLYQLADKAFSDRKNEIISISNRAKNLTISNNNDSDISFEERCETIIYDCNEELKFLDRSQFSANVRSILKGEFNYHISYDEIISYKNAIDEAVEIYKSKNKETTKVNEFPINENPNEIKNNFKCNIIDIDKLKKLFSGIKDDFINTKEDNFLAICTGSSKFDKIEWVHKNNHKNFNQTSLICLINLITDFQTKPSDDIVNEFFYIKDIKVIKLRSPNKDEYYFRYHKKFTLLLN